MTRLGSNANFPEILTAKELEQFLRIDAKTIYGYVQRGIIPYVRIQSNVRFRRDEVLEWLEEKSYRPRQCVSGERMTEKGGARQPNKKRERPDGRSPSRG